MNASLIISIAAAGLAFIALIVSFICFIKLFHNTAKIINYAAHMRGLEIALHADRKMFDELHSFNNDAIRRIALLESRQQKIVKEDTEDVLVENVMPSKPTITERRHRVLALAARGQTIETIASTLGMLPGEVELILNLNRNT